MISKFFSVRQNEESSLGNERGFTLIELTLVIVLLGILTAMSMPLISSLEGTERALAASRSLNDCRYAQIMATTTGDVHGIRTTGSASEPTGYEVYNATTGTVIDSPETHQAMTIDLSSEYENISFKKEYDIQFDSVGTPQVIEGSDYITIQDSQNEISQIQVNDAGMIVYPKTLDPTK